MLENTKNQKTHNAKNELVSIPYILGSIVSTLLKTTCKGPIVGVNGLSLLKKPSEIEVCQNHGIYEKPEKSLLMFSPYARDGNGERAVITRGLSSYSYKTDDKYKIGNKDKIITSFNTNNDVKYSLVGACGVIYQGVIHFFGGLNHPDWNRWWKADYNYKNQHFGLNEKRDFVKYKNLDIDFSTPQCSNFKIVNPNSQSGEKEVVLLCFDFYHKKNCYQFDDGDLSPFADANENHYWARLGQYKDQLITVGSRTHQKNRNSGLILQ